MYRKRCSGITAHSASQMALLEEPTLIAPTQRVRGDRSEEYEKRKAVRYETRLSLPFVGVDGEGGNVDDEQMVLFGPTKKRHEYLLLRAGTFALETGKPLTWHECLGFLADLPKPAEYVSFFFDYDATMMLRGLTPERIRRLMNRRSRTKPGETWPMPLDVGPFQIDYLPGKEFKVRRLDHEWTVIQDVGPFFQSTFVKALDRWKVGTEEEREAIKKGKDLRAEFGELTDEIREYNELEIKLLESLMRSFRDTCHQLGYMPQKWEGPGLLASAAFRKHKIPGNKSLNIITNSDLMFFGRSAYYGGWFETGIVGPTPPSDQWDIHSAYPFAMLSLPCLTHGTWSKFSGTPIEPLYVGYVSFQANRSAQYYGLPVRDKAGNISRPASGAGWYWSSEIDAVRRGGYQAVTIHEGWQYHRECSCRPFAFNEGLYNARQRMGASAMGIVLKNLLNSEYGKLAQSIGSPYYSNPVWSGLITAQTRGQILDAIYQAEDSRDIYMIATDGIFARKGALDLPVSDALGGWSKEEHPYLFIIQPGLYFTGGELGEPKTRGVPQKAIVKHKDDFIKAFENVKLTGDGKEGGVVIKLPTFFGARQAIHQDNLSLMGEWLDIPRTVTFDWSSKRVGFHQDGLWYLTDPPEGGEETVPYKATLGVELPIVLAGIINDAMEEQPDWVPISLF